MQELSVIIPAYNAQKTIESTLQSIIKQTAPPGEIIVVDDGSTDKTVEIVKQFSEVIYVRQTNSGVSWARNYGVSLASKTWIAFCDADDIWHPNKIEICARCIKEFPRFSFLYHDFFLFKEHEGLFQKETESSKSAFSFFLENHVVLEDLFQRSSKVHLALPVDDHDHVEVYLGNVFKWLILGNFILPSTMLITKQKFLEQQGFDIQLPTAEDTEFFLRLSKETDFMYVDFPLAEYRKSETGLTSNKLSLLENGMRALIRNCVDDQLIYEKFRKSIDLAISRRYSRMSYLHLSELRTNEARKTAMTSIRYCPTQRKGWIYLASSLIPTFALAIVRKYKAHKRVNN